MKKLNEVVDSQLKLSKTKTVHDNTKQQGQTANIAQNTTNQGYQQDQ